MNATVTSKENGVWSVFYAADLYDDSISIANSSVSSEGSSNASWACVPAYLSDTSISDDKENWSDMPSLRTVSNSDISEALDVDIWAEEKYVDEEDNWFSEVGDDSLGDDLGVEADSKSAMAEVNDEEEETFATMLTKIVQPTGHVDLYNSGTMEYPSPYVINLLLTMTSLPSRLPPLTSKNFQQ